MRTLHYGLTGLILLIVLLTLMNCGSGPGTPGNSFNLVNGTPTATGTIIGPTATDVPGTTATPTNTPTATATSRTSYTYEALEYVVTDPAGKRVILRSRGSGHGTSGAYFDVYIEDEVQPGTTAFRGDPIWFTYPMTIEEALEQTDWTQYRTGSLPGLNAEQGDFSGDYYLDYGGGSDLGPSGIGKSYELHGGPISAAKISARSTKIIPAKKRSSPQFKHITLSSRGTTVINMRTEGFGQIIRETPSSAVNQNGAMVWNGSEWVVNNTYVHRYFIDVRTGERVKDYNSLNVDSTVTNLADISFQGYTVRKSLYTYTVPGDGTGPEHMSDCYITSFEYKWMDAAGNLQKMVFLPALKSEE